MSQPYAVPVPLVVGASQIVRAAGPVVYLGYSIRETAGSAAVFRLWDNGSAASGTIVDMISLAANDAKAVMHPFGIWLVNGLFIERVSGTTYEGSVRLG